MSRAYRIKVRETLRRVIRAEDHVSSQLELLELLPAAQMGELLGKELIERGFRREGNRVERTQGAAVVSVDLLTGEVTVRAESSEDLTMEGEREGVVYDDAGPSQAATEERLRDQLKEKLEADVDEQVRRLQRQVTDRLEAELVDLKRELDQAVNRATAAALKIKAAQLGQIKQMTEDPVGGSLTIVVEV